jgi:hypothetical protein
MTLGEFLYAFESAPYGWHDGDEGPPMDEGERLPSSFYTFFRITYDFTLETAMEEP